MLNGLAQSIFACALLSNMLWTTGLMNLVYLCPFGSKWREGVCLMLTQLGWRLALYFAPWVRTIGDLDYVDQWSLIVSVMNEFDEEDRKAGRPTRPLFILGNHTSFFDTVLAVVKMPPSVLWRCRTYMDHHLFKLPILSTICKSVGHFPVYFKSDQDGVFKVDAQKMESVEARVDNHLKTGGWLCFFPEGQMNKDPDKVLPFRYGGMKRALEFDARIVMLVFRGNQTVWPKKAKIGGLPGKVRYSMRPIAPNGAKNFVEMARAEHVPEEENMADAAILARRGQELMQAQYDALAQDPKPALSDLADKVKKKD